MASYLKSVRFRAWVVGFILLIPQLLQFYFGIERTRADIERTERQRAGVQYLQGVWPVRVAVSSALGAAPDQVSFDKVIAPLKDLSSQYDARFDTTKITRSLFEELQSEHDAANLERISIYTDRLVSEIGDASKLILDPDLSSHYAMSLVVERYIELSSAASNVMAAARSMPVGNYATLAAANGFHAATTRIQSAHEKMMQAWRTAEANTTDPVVRSLLNDKFDAFLLKYGRFSSEIETFNQSIVIGEYNTAKINGLSDANLAMHHSLTALYNASLNALDGLLLARIEKFTVERDRGLIFGALTTAFAFIVAYLALSRVMYGLFALRGGLLKMSEGDFSTGLVGTGRRDEVGALARAATRLRDSIVQKLNTNFSEEREELVRHEHARAVADVAADLNNTVQGTITSIDSLGRELSQSVQFVSDSAVSTRTAIGNSVAALDVATNNVRAATDGLEDVARAVAEIAQQASAAATVSRSAKAGGELAKSRANDLSAAMSEIEAILKIVQSIAGQTNLLALNATIEAARAGEAGRGFAIVAQEVKSLSMQTAKATDDIHARLAAVSQVSRYVLEAIDDMVQSITTVDSTAISIASAVEEHNVTTAEISERVREAVIGSANVVAQIEDMAIAAEATGTIAKDLDELASKLSGEASRLKSETSLLIERLTA